MSMYLALSGTTHGITAARSSGSEVAMQVHLQSAMKYAIHGRRQDAVEKYKAMDIFATNVRHLGPTYSRTVKNRNLTIMIIRKLLHQF